MLMVERIEGSQEVFDMKLTDVMTSGVVAIKEDETLGEARERMESLDIHALPVTDCFGVLVGIVSSEDLVRGHELTLPVSRVMTSPVHTLPPEAETRAAVILMRKHRHHHVVVLEGQKIVGMVSSLDLLALLE
jgi:CBS domain-containing protein